MVSGPEHIVCHFIGGVTGYKEATGQWIPPEPQLKDVEVKCGRTEIVVESIVVLSPQVGQTVKSPLLILGTAVGFWFFEGDFPVYILDNNKNVLVSGYVTAQDEWMTENFVPFKGELDFKVDEEIDGFLVLEKDNPSGLPENDEDFRIPIVLSP